MTNIDITVNNKTATVTTSNARIVCGNSDYTITFSFSQEWDKYEKKTARFIYADKYEDKYFTGNVCECPIISNAREVKIGVYAGDISTTTPARIDCDKSILCDDIAGTKSEGVIVTKGEQGFSAYEVAVNNGFEGTEEEWLESLKGSGGGGGLTEIPDDSISTAKIQDRAVTNDKIAYGTILGTNIKQREINNVNIEIGGIVGLNIRDKEITPKKLDREYLELNITKKGSFIEVPKTPTSEIYATCKGSNAIIEIGEYSSEDISFPLLKKENYPIPKNNFPNCSFLFISDNDKDGYRASFKNEDIADISFSNNLVFKFGEWSFGFFDWINNFVFFVCKDDCGDKEHTVILSDGTVIVENMIFPEAGIYYCHVNNAYYYLSRIDFHSELSLPETATISRQNLPLNTVVVPVAHGDEGKFMRVVNGAWAAETVPNAEGAEF